MLKTLTPYNSLLLEWIVKLHVALILLVAGLEPTLVHEECPSLTPNVIDFLSPVYM